MRNPFARRETIKPSPEQLTRTDFSPAKASNDGGSIRLGDLVKDRIGGKQGTAIERHYHLNGCEFIHVEASDADDDKGHQNFAVQRLELVKSRPQFHRADESMTGSHLKLGDEVKDVLSGFKGHVTIWVVPLFGSHRLVIDPPLKKDGTQGDASFFDECRLELIAAKDPPKVPSAKRPVAKAKGCVGGTMKRQTMRRDTIAR